MGLCAGLYLHAQTWRQPWTFHLTLGQKVRKNPPLIFNPVDFNNSDIYLKETASDAAFAVILSLLVAASVPLFCKWNVSRLSAIPNITDSEEHLADVRDFSLGCS